MGVEEQVGDTVRLALGRYWTFFGVSGLALVVFAAADGFPKFLVQLAPAWQTLTFGCGCVLLAACFAAVVLDARGKAEPAGRPDLDALGAEILAPRDGEVCAAGAATVVGTLAKPLPDRVELWLFGLEDPSQGPSHMRYYAVARAEVDGRSFQVRAATWMKTPEAAFVIAAVGPNGQALVQLYWALNRRCVELGHQWGGAIETLTDDVRVLTPVRWLRWAVPSAS